MELSLEELFAGLEAAQAKRSQHRLSERMVVDLVLALRQRGLLGPDVFPTSNGQGFVTLAALSRDVLAEVARQGRVEIPELPAILGVDQGRCEEAVKAALAEAQEDDKAGGGPLPSALHPFPAVLRSGNALFSRSYLDSLVADARLCVEEEGLVSISALARERALPLAFVRDRLAPLVGSPRLPGTLRGDEVRSPELEARLRARLRGAMRAAATPAKLHQLLFVPKEATSAAAAPGATGAGAAARTGAGSGAAPGAASAAPPTSVLVHPSAAQTPAEALTIARALVASGAASGRLAGGGALFLPVAHEQLLLGRVDARWSSRGLLSAGDALRAAGVAAGKAQAWLLERFGEPEGAAGGRGKRGGAKGGAGASAGAGATRFAVPLGSGAVVSSALVDALAAECLAEVGAPDAAREPTEGAGAAAGAGDREAAEGARPAPNAGRDSSESGAGVREASAAAPQGRGWVDVDALVRRRLEQGLAGVEVADVPPPASGAPLLGSDPDPEEAVELSPKELSELVALVLARALALSPDLAKAGRRCAVAPWALDRARALGRAEARAEAERRAALVAERALAGGQGAGEDGDAQRADARPAPAAAPAAAPAPAAEDDDWGGGKGKKGKKGGKGKKGKGVGGGAAPATASSAPAAPAAPALVSRPSFPSLPFATREDSESRVARRFPGVRAAGEDAELLALLAAAAREAAAEAAAEAEARAAELARRAEADARAAAAAAAGEALAALEAFARGAERLFGDAGEDEDGVASDEDAPEREQDASAAARAAARTTCARALARGPASDALAALVAAAAPELAVQHGLGRFSRPVGAPEEAGGSLERADVATEGGDGSPEKVATSPVPRSLDFVPSQAASPAARALAAASLPLDLRAAANAAAAAVALAASAAARAGRGEAAGGEDEGAEGARGDGLAGLGEALAALRSLAKAVGGVPDVSEATAREKLLAELRAAASAASRERSPAALLAAAVPALAASRLGAATVVPGRALAAALDALEAAGRLSPDERAALDDLRGRAAAQLRAEAAGGASAPAGDDEGAGAGKRGGKRGGKAGGKKGKKGKRGKGADWDDEDDEEAGAGAGGEEAAGAAGEEPPAAGGDAASLDATIAAVERALAA